MTETPTLNRAERRRLETRAKLLQATSELLLAVGYPNLSVRAIAERADVGNGTFYLHFTDKDDVVWTVFEFIAKQVNASHEARLVGLTYPNREYQAWCDLFRSVAEQRALILGLLGRQGSPILQARYMDFLAQIYYENIKAERYHISVAVPPLVLAQFAAGATLRLLLWWLEEAPPYTAEQMAAMLFTCVYLKPPPNAPDF